MVNNRLLMLIGSIFLVLAVVSLAACAAPAPKPAPAPTPAPAPAPAPKPTPTPAPAPAPTPPAAPSPAPAPTPAAKAMTFKAVSFVPVNVSTVRFMKVLADKVNERAKGELTITWAGGPEVIPTSAQGDALKAGRIDMVCAPGSYLSDIVPELDCIGWGEYSPMEERKVGAYEYISKYAKKANAQWLGRSAANNFMYLFTMFEIAKPEDLKGQQIGVVSVGAKYFKTMGATPVEVPKPEWYDTVSKGIVKAYVVPAANVPSYGLTEITKFRVDVPFMGGATVGFWINQDKYNSLPQHLQKLLNDATIEVEQEASDYFLKETENVKQLFQQKGMKTITFPPDVATAFAKGMIDAEWEGWKARVSPEVYTEARKVFLKPR